MFATDPSPTHYPVLGLLIPVNLDSESSDIHDY